MSATTGRPWSAGSTGVSCGSPHKTLALAARATVRTVVSCGASRNKRKMLAIRRIARAEASPSRGPQVTLLLGPAGFDPQKHFSPFTSSILSGSDRALRGWAKGPARRPGDPKGSQKQQPIHRPRLPCSACRPFVLGAPPRAANASLRPRTAILWNRAIRSLPIAVRRQR